MPRGFLFKLLPRTDPTLQQGAIGSVNKQRVIIEVLITPATGKQRGWFCFIQD